MAKLSKQELRESILADESLGEDVKGQLLDLLKTPTFGLVWEEKTEDVIERLREELPVLKEDKSKAIISDDPDSPNHVLIEADNLDALVALTYTHAGRFDVIYIDPPYNTGATQWKYNNDFVDKNDSYCHSKWLSMMNHRLKIAKRLLNPLNSALILTIDEVECLHIGCMLEQMFPEAKIQKVTSVICPGGRGKKAAVDLSNTEEFIYFVRLGECVIAPEIKNADQMPLGWRGLIRGTLANGRGKHGIGSCGPNQFFPIYVENSTKKIVKIGDPIPEQQSRFSVPQIEGCTAVFPVRPDGTEMNWGCVPEAARDLLNKGYLKVSGYAPNKPQQYGIHYLTKGVIKDILDGKAIITGRAKDGSVEGFYPIGKPTLPTTVWNRPTHNATQYGTNLLTSIFGGQMFDYPKSIYAVEDCIRFVAKYKPNSLILDFFAGSGTTMHATMLLNKEDGGHRQCFLVTNNESNICEEVTYERNKRVIQGYKTPKGEQVAGLKNNNLRYYRVEHTPRKHTHENKILLAQAMTEMLQIKWNAYKEPVRFGNLKVKPKYMRYFEGDENVLIIYVPEIIPYIVKEIKELPEGKKLHVYVAADGNYAYSEEFAEVAKRIELASIPAVYYNAIRSILPEPKEETVDYTTSPEDEEIIAQSNMPELNFDAL